MKFSREEILSLSQLARLPLTDEEVSAFQTDLSKISDFIGKIQSVNVSDVPQTSVIESDHNEHFADDRPEISKARDDVFALVPNREGDFVQIDSLLNRDT